MYPYVSIVQVLCIQREKTKRDGGGAGGGIVGEGSEVVGAGSAFGSY